MIGLQYELTFTLYTGKTPKVYTLKCDGLKGLTIEFNLRSMTTSEEPTLNLTIYNLSRTIRNLLSQTPLIITSEDPNTTPTVSLRIGRLGSNLVSVYSGLIINSSSSKDKENIKTQIQSVSLLSLISELNCSKNFSASKNFRVSKKDVVDFLISQIPKNYLIATGDLSGLLQVSMNEKTIITDQVLSGKGIYSQIKEYCKNLCKPYFDPSTNTLNIVPVNTNLPLEKKVPKLISTRTGMLNIPKRQGTISTLVDTMFIRGYSLNDLVSLESVQFKDCNGLYRVNSSSTQGVISPSVSSYCIQNKELWKDTLIYKD